MSLRAAAILKVQDFFKNFNACVPKHSACKRPCCTGYGKSSETFFALKFLLSKTMFY